MLHAGLQLARAKAIQDKAIQAVSRISLASNPSNTAITTMAKAEESPRASVSRLYIAMEDCKEKYQKPAGTRRIKAYIKSVNMSRKVEISVDTKPNGTVVFAFEKQKDYQLVHEDIQGEICTIDSAKKYKTNPPEYLDLPSEHIKAAKVSETTCKAMKREDQTRLQHEAHSENPLTIENLEKHDQKHSTGPCQLRQFGCPICKKSWWQTVLKSKPVSRCRGGKCGNVRYDALPRSKEFGIGRFVCPSERCSKVFYGYCEAKERLKCRKCGALARPYIHPKWRKRRRKSSLNAGAAPFTPRSHTHSGRHNLGPSPGPSPGPHFEPVSGYYSHEDGQLLSQFSDLDLDGRSADGVKKKSDAKHHRSSCDLGSRSAPQASIRRKPIFNASTPHKSVGDTESTCMSQMDFEKDGEEVDLAYDEDDHEEKIGNCNFECDCGHNYTSKGRMKDQAECYKCGMWNSPLSWALPGDGVRKSDAKHSCSRCLGRGHCPNLA